jgi:hypothetical protein
VHLWRSADQVEIRFPASPLKSKKYIYGEGFSRRSGAVNVERAASVSRLQALREHHLEDIAGGDVLLGLQHRSLVIGRLIFERSSVVLPQLRLQAA